MPDETHIFTTAGGVRIVRHRTAIEPKGAIEPLVDALNNERGVVLSSGYDYPGRYTRWDVGLKRPILELVSRDRHVDIRALSARGLVVLPAVAKGLEATSEVESMQVGERVISVEVQTPQQAFPEELRSRQPSVFSIVRAIVAVFQSSEDAQLGLYGAFGYDLTFQFEPVQLRRERPANQRDLVLYLPDELTVVDHQKEKAFRCDYEFEYLGSSTRDACSTPYDVAVPPEVATGPTGSDHGPGEYAAAVERARKLFKRGDLFELVLGQTFREPCTRKPSAIFRWLREHNPAPYALLLNLGQSEHLVGASPEMCVRVDGTRVETCPISGTIARGQDPIQDAERIRELLNSEKDEAELSMCTDVDRNDKSRICVPGSVKVIGRRQIELYSRLIHTVDHVEGTLRPEFDALDAFLTHTWAVTVTGAPKPAALQKVEDEEKSPRAWYGGAIGWIGFDGNLNTGLTLRTVRLQNGMAEVRAGATLLYDSDPELEERETRVKASAFLDAVRGELTGPAISSTTSQVGAGREVLLIDHQDSFVHTLANYFRQTGAKVRTVRRHLAEQAMSEPTHLVVLSPGPGSPADFELNKTIEAAMQRKLPIFGVCLGLQGIAEYFGASLSTLEYPMHGKPSKVRVTEGDLLANLSEGFVAGRYHSLFVQRDSCPDSITISAETEDGVIMALEHKTLPIAAVQFHPESILSLGGNMGLRLIQEVMAQLPLR